MELETYPLGEVDFRRRGQASGTASILWEIGRDELLARAMKICLYPLVRLISGKTDQTITREDDGSPKVLGGRIALLKAACMR